MFTPLDTLRTRLASIEHAMTLLEEACASPLCTGQEERYSNDEDMAAEMDFLVERARLRALEELEAAEASLLQNSLNHPVPPDLSMVEGVG